MALSPLSRWLDRCRRLLSFALAGGWLRYFCVGLFFCCAILAAVALAEPRGASALPLDRPTPAALVLIGERLFKSPLLSADGTVSCSTCHIASLGFSGDRPLPVGVGGYIGRRRAPALLGLRDAKALMWDGRAASLPAQVVMPLEGKEMAISWPAALSRLDAGPGVLRLFEDTHVARLDRETVIDALAAYVASLDAGSSRFDRFFYGGDRNALTSQEAWGLRLFVRKAGCATCHLLNGEAAPFTDGSIHVTGFGRTSTPRDRGRADVTGDPADVGAFKTPGLRAVALRPYLMHDGSMASLRQVVERYNRPDRVAFPNLDERLTPLFLAREEVDAIVAFLGALTPEDATGAGMVARSP
jgi:cytochrome c peroxidase